MFRPSLSPFEFHQDGRRLAVLAIERFVQTAARLAASDLARFVDVVRAPE
jgi:hypothetical protein